MPALIAFPTGVVNEVELVSVVAIPAALADTAELIADTISDATEFAEPVHGGVGHAVLGRHEEAVRGHVVDEPELELRRARERVAAGRGGRRARRRRTARRAAGGQERRRRGRRADQAGPGKQLPPGVPVLHIEFFYCLFYLRGHFAHADLRV